MSSKIILSEPSVTYCVGILLRDGLVLAADSRTNAGVDYVSTFRKLTIFELPGDRFLTLMGAGNLATTQAYELSVQGNGRC